MSDENARLGAAYLESTRKMNESGEVETSGVDISAMEIMTGNPITKSIRSNIFSGGIFVLFSIQYWWSRFEKPSS